MQKQEAEQEFEKRIKDNQRLIFKVCRIYAYTSSDQKDLFQDIVVQLWTAYPRFKGDSKFTTWLYRVAINTAISGLRKQRHFIETYAPAALPVTITDDHSANEKEIQLQELYKAIEQLTQIEKAIIMLYMEDKSYEEMEDILGIGQGNLRVKMNRIKEKIRQKIKTY